MADPDFGSDLAGIDDINPALSTATGRRALAEAVCRRLSSPEGSLPGDPSYGYDLTMLIGSTTPASTIQSKVRAQCVAEEGVSSALVTVNQIAEALEVALVLGTADGPLKLVLLATAVSVEILGIE